MGLNLFDKGEMQSIFINNLFICFILIYLYISNLLKYYFLKINQF